MGFSFRPSPRRKTETPDIRQGEHAECGLAALGILLGYHGVHISLGELRQRAGSTLLGSTLRQLRQIAESEGFTTSARRAEPSDLEKLGLPLIAHMRFIHFAVVERISEKAVHLNDPSSGPIVVTREEFSRDFTGIVLRLSPRDTVPRGRPFSLARAIIAAFRPQIPLFLLACALAATSGGLASTGLWAFAGKEDAVTPPGGLFLLSAFAQGGAFLLAALLAYDAAKGVRQLLMSALASAPNRYYLDARPDRTHGFFNALRGLHRNGAPFGTVALLWLASALTFSVAIAPIQTLPTVALSLLQAAILLGTAYRRSSHAARFGRDAMPVHAVSAGYLADSERFKIGRGADSFFASLAGSHARDASYAVEASEQYDTTDTIVATLDLCKIALPIGLSARGIGASEDLLFALIVAAASSIVLHFATSDLGFRPTKEALLRLLDPPPQAPAKTLAPRREPTDIRLIMENAEWAPSSSIPAVISGLSLHLRAGETAIAHGMPGSGATSSDLGFRPTKEALLRLLDPPPQAPAKTLAPRREPTDIRLIMENAEWAPSSSIPAVISGLSLHLRAGETAIAHGMPGSGATSFARLAAGLIKPTSGLVRLQCPAVLIDHQRFLVPGTLRHNLSLGEPDIDEQTLRSALEAVRLDKVVEHRGGLDFVLKGDNPRLSGGQIRRIMIARALCRSPGIVVLDGALDNIETELAGSILANLGKRGLAVVVTTKNRDLLRFADQSVELGAQA
ncbi:cysteine peptidase family C39 domain-containing protein [Pleomorphomonas sp. JP5]|uniref:cysteine peptidase family C39 domain-containing protein n=1 Tax=Pleomorphomonas sp. JP5 TaxID=2942998 RepID=UPI002043CFCB|nr:cysteine peptidase family C39 domain-containing protein [Pleomorphomonas sp. JP5]MCM5558960.1 cysteine peptidase family C39 domain-containing protein [Pleomorphomonas sp. JP5]